MLSAGLFVVFKILSQIYECSGNVSYRMVKSDGSQELRFLILPFNKTQWPKAVWSSRWGPGTEKGHQGKTATIHIQSGVELLALH